MIVHCDYCGRRAEFVDSKAVYGKSYGMIYLCRACGAYVGTHPGSSTPLGRLANAQLRKWKRAAHEAFDPLWKSKLFTRYDAYIWLAEKMRLPLEKTHIGMFDVPECKQVIKLSKRYMEGGFSR
jgi:hypothetical protein